MDEGRQELLHRMSLVNDLSRLSYEDKEMLEEWLAEPRDDDHAQTMVNSSSVKILERIRNGVLLEQIYLVQTLRKFVFAQREGQRLLEEAQTKLRQVWAIVGQHVDDPSAEDDRLEVLGVALEIEKVLDRPDDPWDVGDATDE